MIRINPTTHPLLHRIYLEAEWTREDQFPAFPEWADEYEAGLRFVEREGELDRFLSRLKKSAYQRDRALAEIAFAYFSQEKCSLPILQWEPPGEGGKKGEYLIGSADKRIFVEVKTGGWQKDIVKSEGRESPRLLLPKYLEREVRSVGPWSVVRNAISNAYPKFRDSVPNLLVIKDDYFIDLDTFNVDLALYEPASPGHTVGYLAENGYFVDRRFKRLGAIGMFNLVLESGVVTYRFTLFENPNALNRVKLPHGAFHGYPRCNKATSY